MGSLFKPDVPQPDPAATQLAEQERARAEAANTRATQDQLTQETLLRSRNRGVRSLFGSLGGSTSLLGSG